MCYMIRYVTAINQIRITMEVREADLPPTRGVVHIEMMYHLCCGFEHYYVLVIFPSMSLIHYLK